MLEGMNAVWTHLTFKLNSMLMKWIVRLICGSAVRLDQISVVATDSSAIDTAFLTSSRHCRYIWQNHSAEMVLRWQRETFIKSLDYLLEETLALDCTNRVHIFF